MSHGVVFVSYGDNAYQQSKQRIAAEAKSMGIFTDIHVLGPQNLQRTFLQSHASTLRIRRGAGLWCWKSQICLQIMDGMQDGDILCYCDAGCTLNINGRERLLEYLTMLSTSDAVILAFQQNHKECTWTKMSLIKHLDAENLMHTCQLVGGIFFLKKCVQSIDILKKWRETMAITSLVDDSPSTVANHHTFRESRHDQSVWSLLVKKEGIDAVLIIPDETYPSLPQFPIWATRKK